MFFLVKLEQILVYIRENFKNDKIVIHGDFNIDLLKLRENSFADRFLILMSSFGLMPVILRPTRITVNSRSIIDNIFVSDTSMFRTSNVIKSKISDHSPIVSCFGNSDIGGSSDEFVVVEKRQLNENVIALKWAVEEHNWDQVKQCRSISDTCNVFSGELYAFYNKYCPKIKHKIKKKYFNKPYINDVENSYQRKEKNSKKVLWKSITFGEAFREIRNKVNSAVRAAKAEFYRKKLDNSADSRGTWKIINIIMGRSDSRCYPEEFFVNVNWVRDPVLVADEANKYFCSIGERLASVFQTNDDHLGYLQRTVNSLFSFSLVTEEEIKSIVLHSKNSSPGIDELPMLLFKENIDLLANIITYICNESFSQGVFPEKLAVALVTFIYKKGDWTHFENYRSISILNAFSKIMEKIVTNQLTAYFVSGNLLNSAQFGFIPGRSTEEAMQWATRYLYSSFDDRKLRLGHSFIVQHCLNSFCMQMILLFLLVMKTRV